MYYLQEMPLSRLSRPVLQHHFQVIFALINLHNATNGAKWPSAIFNTTKRRDLPYEEPRRYIFIEDPA